MHPRGRIVPNYATIDRDDAIPFWRELGKRVHEYDCKYIMQLATPAGSGTLAASSIATGLSSTDKPEPLHGFRAERMTVDGDQRDGAAFAARRTARPRSRAGRRRAPRLPTAT